MKGKSGKINAGAVVVGTIVARPVGTAVGSAMGAGSKRSTNIRENTQSVSNQVKVNTPATLRFRNITTGENITTTQIETTANQLEFDAVEEIKRFKELADAGIITNEEFKIKKKKLLGL